jgi:hypothetical protein
MTETRPDSSDSTSSPSSEAKKAPAKAVARKAPAKAAAKKAPAKAAARKAIAGTQASERASIRGPAAAERPGVEADTSTEATTTVTEEAVKRAEASVAKIRKLNERAITVTRDAGQSALDAYETALEAIVSLERRLAGATQLEWVNALVRTQAEFTQSIGKAYLSAARDLLR